MELQIGQVLGDYEILRVLGAGGMGKVYQVRNNISHRVEAMKVVLPDVSTESGLEERFLREIRISASLEHPNIAALRTAQQIGNQLVMIMEFVEGDTLDALMRAARLSVDKALAYTTQALSALSYAHSRGVIHRDIKPGNIMLTPAGVIKLMDFGIAKLATDHKLTKTGLMVGSVYYMSPEQIEGRTLDARSDIYSLGVTLYEIVTGSRPFNGDSDYQIMAAHLKGSPEPPRDIDPSLPPQLNEIILMALATDPAQRFQSADAFRTALSSVVSKTAAVTMQAGAFTPLPVSASALPAAAPPPKRDRRLMYMIAGSLATIAVIAAAVIELPKYWHTSARGPTASSAAQVSATPAPTETPSAAAATPVAEQVPPTPDPQAPTNAPVRATPLQPNPAVRATHILGNADAKMRASAPLAVKAPVQNTSGQAAPAEAGPIATPQPQSNSAQVPVVDVAQLSRLRERMMLMAARAGAVGASLQTLQREQARQGVGLRSDMVAAQHRLNYHMDEAESNLKQNNPSEANKKLDAAERELESLEKFLGK